MFGFNKTKSETKPKQERQLVYEDNSKTYEKGMMYFVSFKSGHLQVFKTIMRSARGKSNE